jgi:hypothetical protein
MLHLFDDLWLDKIIPKNNDRRQVTVYIYRGGYQLTIKSNSSQYKTNKSYILNISHFSSSTGDVY